MAGATAHPYLVQIPQTVTAMAADPDATNTFVVAKQSAAGQPYGIYLASSKTVNGITTLTGTYQQLVAPTYVSVGSIAFTQDGTKVVFNPADANAYGSIAVASVSGGANQTPALLNPNSGDAIYSFALGQDSNTVVYSELDGVNTQLWQGKLSTNLASPIELTSATAEQTNSHDYPQISRDGNYVAYSSLPEATNSNPSPTYQIALLTASNLHIKVLGTMPSLDEINPAFNSDGSEVSFLNDVGNLSIYTLATNGTGTETLIDSDNTILTIGGDYWTSTQGRGVGGAPTFSIGRHRRRPHMR